MVYLIFALFFLGYFLVGSLTDMVELSSIAAMISIVFVFGNIYMFWKERKKKED
ncbi:hypothetical protein [Halobacillus salinus]|uniref:hypothetical protein n=1 Tax=Halobacillus salinus TaxID=192814 RepID=UPI001456C308|nr:hypothetical protein [Halobacillus salinus]